MLESSKEEHALGCHVRSAFDYISAFVRKRLGGRYEWRQTCKTRVEVKWRHTDTFTSRGEVPLFEALV